MAKRGRPEKPDDEKRLHAMRIRVTPEEQESLNDAADRAKVTFSVWARRILLRAAAKKGK